MIDIAIIKRELSDTNINNKRGDKFRILEAERIKAFVYDALIYVQSFLQFLLILFRPIRQNCVTRDVQIRLIS